MSTWSGLGALYHDVGKLVTPKFFIENQLGDKNPHDTITPEESRQRVSADVTNGLILAQGVCPAEGGARLYPHAPGYFRDGPFLP